MVSQEDFEAIPLAPASSDPLWYERVKYGALSLVWLLFAALIGLLVGCIGLLLLGSTYDKMDQWKDDRYWREQRREYHCMTDMDCQMEMEQKLDNVFGTQREPTENDE